MNFETLVSQAGAGMVPTAPQTDTLTPKLDPLGGSAGSSLNPKQELPVFASHKTEMFSDSSAYGSPLVSPTFAVSDAQAKTSSTSGSDTLLGQSKNTSLTGEFHDDKLVRKSRDGFAGKATRHKSRIRAIASSSDPIRLEAEKFSSRKTFQIESSRYASNGKVLSLVDRKNDQIGTASTSFNGPNGKYQVVLGYFDEADGVGQIETRIGGKTVATTVLNQNLGSDVMSDRTQVKRTLAANLTINKGDRIELIGKKDDGECTRIDYVELVPVQMNTPAPPPPPPVPPAPTPTPGSSPNPTGSLVFADPFTGSRSPRWEAELGAPHQFQVENNTARFELRKSDPIVNNGKRAELKFKEYDLSKGAYWYNFRMYLPKDYVYDPNQEIITQWHGPTDGKYSSPNLTIRTEKGQFRIEGAWFPNGGASDKSNAQRQLFWSGNYETGKWIDWKMYVKFGASGDGALQVWKDGNQVVNFKGTNTDGLKDFLMMKMGMYKSGWQTGATSTTSTRTIYFDDVKIWKA